MALLDFKEALWGNFEELEKEECYSQIRCNDYEGHSYIDLGLPSGTLWATENISNATIKDSVIEINRPDDFQRFVFGKDVNIHDNFEVDNIFIDKVSQFWGEGWITPSKEDFEELMKFCVWKPINNNGIWGFIIEGQNGNKIFLPTNLSKTNLIENNENEVIYLTSTFKRGYNKESDKSYIGNESRLKITRWYNHYSFELPEWVNISRQHEKYIFIRPILKYKKNSLEIFKNNYLNIEGVDLGLSSGNLWSPINIGFCEGNNGALFQWGDIEPNEDYDGGIMNDQRLSVEGNPEYDIAAKLLGEGWVTPNIKDFHELINECWWQRIIKDDAFWGYKVSNKNNPDRFILFRTTYVSSHDAFAGIGYYWSSSIVNDDALNNKGIALKLTIDLCDITWLPRNKMCYVRPVKKEPQK